CLHQGTSGRAAADRTAVQRADTTRVEYGRRAWDGTKQLQSGEYSPITGKAQRHRTALFPRTSLRASGRAVPDSMACPEPRLLSHCFAQPSTGPGRRLAFRQIDVTIFLPAWSFRAVSKNLSRGRERRSRFF